MRGGGLFVFVAMLAMLLVVYLIAAYVLPGLVRR